MVEKVCGIDVHKDLLVATILDPQTQDKQTMNFRNSLDSIDQLQNWLKQNQCQTAAMESTSVYWIPLYDALEAAKIQVTLANAYQVKAIPGRKTDQKDSEWLAHLQSAGLIKPSYIPPKHLRDLRELTRLRTKCVQTRTQNKNRVQKVLNRVNIRLRTVLSNIFGKAGTEIVEGLMQGKTVKTILNNTKNKQLQVLSEEIEAAAQGTLSENDVFVLQQLTTAIKNVNEQIKQIDKRIATLTDKGIMAVLCSVPGVGVLAGATISAELGDVHRFSNCKQVASWCGLAPSLHQSAGVTSLGHITKRGSKALRWIMIEVAHGAVRVNGRFKSMFLRVAAKKGSKVAYVAVARKILTVVWHLLVNGERYVEEGFSKVAVRVRSGVSSGGGLSVVSLDALVDVLRNAGYVVSKG